MDRRGPSHPAPTLILVLKVTVVPRMTYHWDAKGSGEPSRSGAFPLRGWRGVGDLGPMKLVLAGTWQTALLKEVSRAPPDPRQAIAKTSRRWRWLRINWRRNAGR